MKLKEIQDLIDFISQSGLEEVSIEADSFKLSIKKHGSVNGVVHTQVLSSQPLQTLSSQQQIQTTSSSQQENTQKQIASSSSSKSGGEENYITIKSPMIGTFYRSSSPETPPFVNVGDTIEKGKAICIIEAMKLFNEIESEFSGRVVKILVDNASPVEYDQPLFLIEAI